MALKIPQVSDLSGLVGCHPGGTKYPAALVAQQIWGSQGEIC